MASSRTRKILEICRKKQTTASELQSTESLPPQASSGLCYTHTCMEEDRDLSPVLSGKSCFSKAGSSLSRSTSVDFSGIPNNEENWDNQHVKEHQLSPILGDSHSQFTKLLENDCDDGEIFDDSDADPNYQPIDESSSSESDNNHTPEKKSDENVAENERNDVNEAESIVRDEQNRKRGRKTIKGETRKVRMDRKCSRNMGKEYTTSKGKNVSARKCRELRNCRMKCNERISAETTGTLFKEFWSLAEFNKRVAYVAALLQCENKKVTKTKIPDVNKRKNRLVSYKYNLNVDGKLVPICKACFLRTFDLTVRFVTDVQANKSASFAGVTHDDRRGKHIPANKTSEEDLETVRQHILAIPSYESHYTRKKSSQRYLPSHCSLSRMYQEYKAWDKVDHAVSRKIYERIFHEMGIKIKAPKGDTCAKCDKLQSMIRNENDLVIKQQHEISLQEHQDEAENAYASKRKDKESCRADETRTMYTFDLQQCLPTPDIQTSIAFYKRQLWTYNLTLHRCDDKQSFCFMWHEGVASRGANQIASCLYKHLLTLPAQVKHVTLYSDTCAGQNKNSFLPLMFTILMQKINAEHIDHKFLVPGHTRMECDSDHSIIEKKKKKYGAPIDHPRDWMQLVKLCGNSKPFLVKEMSRTDFFEFSGLFKGVYQTRKINEDGEKIIWKDIKWLRYTKDEGMVMYKTSLDENEPFKMISYRRRGRGPSTANIDIPLSYDGPQFISKEKKRNLLELLPYIDQNFHEFYKNLPCKNEPNVLPEDSSDESDSSE